MTWWESMARRRHHSPNENIGANSAEEGKVELMTSGGWVRGMIYRRDCTLWEMSTHTAEAASSSPVHIMLCGGCVFHFPSTSQVSSSCSNDSLHSALLWSSLSCQILFSGSVADSKSHWTFVRNVAIIVALYLVGILVLSAHEAGMTVMIESCSWGHMHRRYWNVILLKLDTSCL